jgi:hypothetical protein
LLRILGHAFCGRLFGGDLFVFGERDGGKRKAKRWMHRWRPLFASASNGLLHAASGRQWGHHLVVSHLQARGLLARPTLPILGPGISVPIHPIAGRPRGSPAIVFMLSIQVRGCRLWSPSWDNRGPRGVSFELTMPRCVSGRAGTRQRSELRWRQVGPPAGNLVGIAREGPCIADLASRKARNSESRQHPLKSAVSRGRIRYSNLRLRTYHNEDCLFYARAGGHTAWSG